MKNLKPILLRQKLKKIISMQICLALWLIMLLPESPRGQMLFSIVAGTLLALGELKRSLDKNKESSDEYKKDISEKN